MPIAKPGPRAALVLALAALATPPDRAAADAVPPPPSRCPRGQIGITSHAGPECVEPAPKNCPPGWSGVIRGRCMLLPCQKDADCGAGASCREADICTQEHIQDWGWGKRDDGDQSTNRPLFAGPPMRFDPPLRVTEAVDICGGGNPGCAEGAACNKVKICLPGGAKAPGRWSGPKERAVVSRVPAPEARKKGDGPSKE